MSPEAMRLSIAKSLGWTDIEGGKYPDGLPPASTDSHYVDLPNWTTDANAACGLCDVLKAEGYWCDIQSTPDGWSCTFRQTGGEEYYHTAQPLAESVCGAFLKAKGIWEEGL